MALITITDISIRFRGPNLFEGVSCQIDEGQRIGLLGRNGAGKTTFMRMICGDLEPDTGQIVRHENATVSLLPQDVPKELGGTIRDVVAKGISPEPFDTSNRWEADHAVDRILSQMELDAEAKFDSLSSGMKRRVLLAQCLVNSPKVLVLDEPTNHLDVDTIEWLEQFLQRWPGTILFVTHDRMFLQRIANRILEIDQGQLFDWSCDYETFLTRKESELAAQEKQDALFDKKLAEEEAWIRQGIKARRTRNEGRVKALKEMRRIRSERRDRPGKVQLDIQQGQRSGNLIAEVKKISFAYDAQPIVRDFSTLIMRGDKIGIIGRNGAGKTTLLRLMLGELQAQDGSVRLGTNLQIAYFDQMRAQLNESATVQENVSDGYDTININGSSRHVIGYLQDFLFSPERARTEVRFLSGGERNRILLAKLFAKPANVLVMDEPTNDLDAETLELLEERLIDFQGTLLLVSHDRAFLNNVVTSTIVFEGASVHEYVGGYDDWQRQKQVLEEKQKPPQPNKAKQKPAASDSPSKRRLSFKEKKELEQLPQVIEKLELEQQEIHNDMASENFYKQSGDIIAQAQDRLSKIEAELSECYARWEELESIS